MIDSDGRDWFLRVKSATFTSPFPPDAVLEYIPTDAAVLDFGCGYGRLIEFLVSHRYQNITGIDISERLVEKARRRYPELNLGVGGVEQLPHEPTFNAVMICAVIENFLAATDRAQLVEALSRALHPCGLVFVAAFVQDPQYKDLYAKAAAAGHPYGTLILQDKDLTLLHSTSEDIDVLFASRFTKMYASETLFRTWTGRKTSGYQALFRLR